MAAPARQREETRTQKVRLVERTMATLERSAAVSGNADTEEVDHRQDHIRDASSSSLVQEISVRELQGALPPPPSSPLKVTPREVVFDFDQDPLQVLLQIHHKGVVVDRHKHMMAFRFRSYPADETQERFTASAGIVAPNTTETAAIVLHQRTQLRDDDQRVIPEWIIMEYCPVSAALAKSYANMIQCEGREKADESLRKTWDAAEFFMEGDVEIGGGLPHVHRRKLRVRFTCTHKPHKDKLVEYLVDHRHNCPLHEAQ